MSLTSTEKPGRDAESRVFWLPLVCRHGKIHDAVGPMKTRCGESPQRVITEGDRGRNRCRYCVEQR